MIWRVHPILNLLRLMIRRAWRSTIIRSPFLAALPLRHCRDGAIARIPISDIELNIAIDRQAIGNARLIVAIVFTTASAVRLNAGIAHSAVSTDRFNSADSQRNFSAANRSSQVTSLCAHGGPCIPIVA